MGGKCDLYEASVEHVQRSNAFISCSEYQAVFNIKHTSVTQIQIAYKTHWCARVLERAHTYTHAHTYANTHTHTK